MGTATKPKPATQEKVTFRSRGTNFKVVLQPSFRRATDYGHEFVPGEYADFAPHGVFETDDPRIIAILRDRPTCGTEFYEIGNEPGALPPSGPVIDEIMEATIELDDARLAQIEAEETGGFKRQDILSMVGSARQKVQRLLEEREQAPPAAEGS